MTLPHERQQYVEKNVRWAPLKKLQLLSKFDNHNLLQKEILRNPWPDNMKSTKLQEEFPIDSFVIGALAIQV